LRAVNVSGRGKIGMAELRHLLTVLGFRDVKSLLQSGNVVFTSDAPAGAELEASLEAETHKRIGLQTAYFVRTPKDLDAIIAGNPFPKAAKGDPSHLVVMFLKDAPNAAGVSALRAAIKGPELVEAKGKHAYIVYPAGIGESRLTTALIEAKLGTQGTGRNWNTVRKLAALAAGDPYRH
jgi:uncharacterized protein (DUF1697 family)